MSKVKKKKCNFLNFWRKNCVIYVKVNQKCKKKYCEKNILFYKGLSINMLFLLAFLTKLFVVFRIYLAFLLLADDHYTGLGRRPPLPEKVSRWRWRLLNLNRAALYNSQFCVIFHYFLFDLRHVCSFLENLCIQTTITFFILRTKITLCRLPLVWQGTPRSPSCSGLLIHPTCLERQRQQAVDSLEPPVTQLVVCRESFRKYGAT